MNDDKKRNQHFGKGLGIFIYFVSEGTRFQKIFKIIVQQINGFNCGETETFTSLVNEWENLSEFALTGKVIRYLTEELEINEKDFKSAEKIIGICKQPAKIVGQNMIRFLASSLATMFYHMALGCTSSAV